MFGCLISGLPVNTDCKQIQADRFVFDNNLHFNPKITFQHLALFPLTPGILSAPSTAGFSAAIYLQFHTGAREGEWQYLGSMGEGKESVFFKIKIPDGLSTVGLEVEVLTASLGISIVPTVNLPVSPIDQSKPQSQSHSLVLASPNTNTFNPTDSLMVAKKLLDNFVNYALSYSQTFLATGNEAFIPAKIITDWYNNTVRKAQLDPVAFFNRLMKSECD